MIDSHRSCPNCSAKEGEPHNDLCVLAVGDLIREVTKLRERVDRLEKSKL